MIHHDKGPHTCGFHIPATFHSSDRKTKSPGHDPPVNARAQGCRTGKTLSSCHRNMMSAWLLGKAGTGRDDKVLDTRGYMCEGGYMDLRTNGVSRVAEVEGPPLNHKNTCT